MTEVHQMEPESRPRAAGQRGKRRYGLIAVAGSGVLAAAVATIFITDTLVSDLPLLWWAICRSTRGRSADRSTSGLPPVNTLG
jgi:hypothetical protein